MVFSGLYTVDSHEHTLLRDALEKLRLNDSSFFFEPESSVLWASASAAAFWAAAHGDHQERLGARVRAGPDHTAPGPLPHHAHRRQRGEVDNPSRWPDPTNIAVIREPVITAKILTNEEYVGGIFKLVEEKRGRQINFEYVTASRVLLTYELPLTRSCSTSTTGSSPSPAAYASLDYQLAGEWSRPWSSWTSWFPGSRSMLCRSSSTATLPTIAAALVSKMRELIPGSSSRWHPGGHRRQDHLPRDGAALRKNVLAKCYGGDISRKRKLLEKQKEARSA